MSVDLAQLRRGLDHEYHAHVVAGEIADGFGDDRNSPQRRDLIEQHQYLSLQARIVLWQRARLKADGLLKEQAQHGAQAMEVIGIDPHVDGQRSPAELAQVKIISRRRGIKYRVQPKIQPARESLTDA